MGCSASKRGAESPDRRTGSNTMVNARDPQLDGLLKALTKAQKTIRDMKDNPQKYETRQEEAKPTQQPIEEAMRVIYEGGDLNEAMNKILGHLEVI